MTLVAAMLLILHSPDGYEVRISPEQITSMHVSREQGNYPKTSKCLINLADGKHVAVRETCEEVQKALETQK